ncbi:MAG TPA: 3-deoxy-7-phosphoheptulonate synthase [Myxococcota bacterium]
MVVVTRSAATRDALVASFAAQSIDAIALAGSTPALLVPHGHDDVAASLRAHADVVAVYAKAPAWPLASTLLSAPRTVSIGGRDGSAPVVVGGTGWTVIAGPCAVETPAQTARITDAVVAAGAHALRGGAYKPRTSPYSFQGLGRTGLELLAAARAKTGRPVVTEVVSPADVDAVVGLADCLQIGARNMQNFALLKACGETKTPVLLKRGFGTTVDELMGSAEHVLAAGNERVILCERGIRTFENSTRFTLDVAAIAWLKQRSCLPVIVDPSHAAGDPAMVVPLALAGLAAGADGLIVEVHDAPHEAKSDGHQALGVNDFTALLAKLSALAPALGRTLELR